MDIEVAESGYGSEAPLTVQELFANAVEKAPDTAALNREIEGSDEWETWTYTEYHRDVMRAAKSMIHLNISKFSGVCIIGFNSPEWLIADLAAIHAGAIPAGIYTTNKPDACQYVIHHCKAEIIFVENHKLLERILSVKDECPALQHVVVYNDTVPEGSPEFVMDWATFMELGNDVEDAAIEEITAAANPGTCATLIYTSGTTGTPKGVMMSHDNLTWTARLAFELLEQKEGGTVLSYLPLSHIAAQMLDVYGPLALGGEVFFARPDALKGTLGQSLKKVRPTLFLGVPRVWEKIAEKMKAMGQETTGLKKTISTWAKGKGLEGNYSTQRGGSRPWGWFFASFIFDKVKAALGLDRCTIRATGAAPIALETHEYFMSLDLPIMEVYGMSETAGLITVSRPVHYRTGSCGVTMPGTEMKLKDPDAEGNGEITTRGRQIMMGYMYNEEKTAQAFTEDGYLRTGDVGKVDEDGFLFITGRIKELIITAGGENVAPVPIEDNIKLALPFISNAVVIGDKKKFLSVLLTLKVDMDMDTGLATNALSGPCKTALAEVGITDVETVEDVLANPSLDEIVTAGLEAANEKAVSRAQMIRKHAFLNNDFGVGSGELTATMKLKRSVVASKYAEVIDEIYA